MNRLFLAAIFLTGACGTTTSGGGAVADTTGSDLQLADSDAVGTDAISDVAADVPDGQGTDASLDIADADAGCPMIPMPLTCCCDGDVTTSLICSAGAWACPQGYGMFTGEQCNGSTCGGPCSLPCAPDTVDTSDAHDDAGPDSAGPDSSDPHAALCTSTGGTVYTGQCCAAASDFPDECLIGACTCAPGYLKEIPRCNCGGGKCFSATTGCH